MAEANLMPWGRLDDGLYDHPKLDALGRSKLPAVGLWTLAISWSNRRLTDGFVPTDRIIALGGSAAIAQTLVTAGMFDRTDGGYLIHDFLTFNESREQVETRREADRSRKRKPAGLRPETNGTPEHSPARAGSRPVPSRPTTPPPPASGGHGSGTTKKPDALRDAQRKAYEERYGPTERYDPKSEL